MAFMHILKRGAFFGASVGSLGASVKWENVATDDENGAVFDVKCCVRPPCAPHRCNAGSIRPRTSCWTSSPRRRRTWRTSACESRSWGERSSRYIQSDFDLPAFSAPGRLQVSPRSRGACACSGDRSRGLFGEPFVETGESSKEDGTRFLRVAA